MRHTRTKPVISIVLASFLAFPATTFAQYVHDYTVSYDSSPYEEIMNFAEAGRGGVLYIAGTRKRDNDWECVVAAYDKTGTLLFDYTYDGPDSTDYENTTAVCTDIHGNFWVAVDKADLVQPSLPGEAWVLQFNALGLVGSVRIAEEELGGDLISDDFGNVFLVGHDRSVSLLAPGPTVAQHHQYAGPYDGGIGAMLTVDNRGHLFTARLMLTQEYLCSDGTNTWTIGEYNTVVHRYSAYGLEREWIINELPCDCSNCPADWRVQDIGADTLGNCYIHTRVSDSEYYLNKFGLDGGLIWRVPVPVGYGAVHEDHMVVDEGGGIYISGYVGGNWLVRKYSADDGSVLWERDIPPDVKHILRIGPHGTIFALSGYTVRYTPDGDLVWGGWLPESVPSSWKQVGPDGCIYTNSGEQKRFHPRSRLWLGGGIDEVLDEVELTLIKVRNDPPFYTEDTLGSFETDSGGYYELEYLAADSFLFEPGPLNPEADTILYGDTLKIALHVLSEESYKRSGVMPTTYSFHMDNARIDSMGVIMYDTLIDATIARHLAHTEQRFNLLVSVEWDATEEYLYSLQASLRYMSNYLYDVSDGQMRLDTVVIFDDGRYWHECDMRIHASNDVWPSAYVGAMFWSSSGYTILMPRKSAWNRPGQWNDTYYNHPLDLTEPIDYRAKAHELGHYAMEFYDEYLFFAGLNASGDSLFDHAGRCREAEAVNYGFMDTGDPWPPGDPRYEYASEMSNYTRYAAAGCQNTNQYCKRHASCWGYFQGLEGRYELQNDPEDTVYMAIVTPSDPHFRTLRTGKDYQWGPNEDMDNLDCDVGSLVVFPETVTGPATGVQELEVEVRLAGIPIGAVDVELWKPITGPYGPYFVLEQGKTCDIGRIWVLGAANGDYIWSAFPVYPVTPSGAALSAANRSWANGLATVGGSGVSRLGNSYQTLSGGEELVLDVLPIEGDYPVICDVNLVDTSGHLVMTALNLFPELPSLTLRTTDRREQSYGFELTGQVYDAHVVDHPGASGRLIVEATDAGASPFFFSGSYVYREFETSAAGQEVLGPSGMVDFRFDSANVATEDVFVLSTPYPVIRTGLELSAIQAGNSQTLAVYPGSLDGSVAVIHRYNDQDIVSAGGDSEAEADLRIWRWSDMSTGWQLVGGSVDTVRNEVNTTVDQPGVYAAFTQSVPTDVGEQHGSTLPYRFELSQNYPNPFNPATTIEYSIPERKRVTIEVLNILGQRVRMLINREESAGSYTIGWDGRDDAGQAVATGVYLYRFRAGDHIETKKMLLLK